MVVVDQVVLSVVADDHRDGARQEMVFQRAVALFLDVRYLGVPFVHADGVLRGLEITELETPQRTLRALCGDSWEKSAYPVILLGH
ncbi:MAG: hypothetical protein V5B30_16135 [Candidatus Accumulibacter delftensis]